jgi:hypothetical protein
VVYSWEGRIPFYNLLSDEKTMSDEKTRLITTKAKGGHCLNPCAAPIARVTAIMIMMTMTALFFVYHILVVGVSRFDS